MSGSKQDLISFSEKQESAFTTIYKSHREKFAMHSHMNGDCEYFMSLQLLIFCFEDCQYLLAKNNIISFLKPLKSYLSCFSWSLPEIRDCLEEAGFKSVHFWIRQMPDSENIRRIEGFGDSQDVKYEEVTSFQQQDSWNAYIVGVAQY